MLRSVISGTGFRLGRWSFPEGLGSRPGPFAFWADVVGTFVFWVLPSRITIAANPSRSDERMSLRERGGILGKGGRIQALLFDTVPKVQWTPLEPAGSFAFRHPRNRPQTARGGS
jgi:hypothetical protein